MCYDSFSSTLWQLPSLATEYAGAFHKNIPCALEKKLCKTSYLIQNVFQSITNLFMTFLKIQIFLNNLLNKFYGIRTSTLQDLFVITNIPHLSNKKLSLNKLFFIWKTSISFERLAINCNTFLPPCSAQWI